MKHNKISEIFEGVSLIKPINGLERLLDYLAGGNTFMIVSEQFTKQAFDDFVDNTLIMAPKHYKRFYVHPLPNVSENYVFTRSVILMSKRFGSGQFVFEIVKFDQFYEIVTSFKRFDIPNYAKFRITIAYVYHISDIKITNKGIEAMNLPEVFEI